MATTTPRSRTRKTAANAADKPALKVVETEAAPAPATKPAARNRKPAAAKTPAKPAAKPAAKAPAKVATPAERSGLAEKTERAAKAKATREAATASGANKKCAECEETKAITKFPTTSANSEGVMGRGKVCRSCRDAKRQAAKKK